MYETRKPNARIGRQVAEGTPAVKGRSEMKPKTKTSGERKVGLGPVLFSVGASLVVLVGIGVGVNHWMSSNQTQSESTVGVAEPSAPSTQTVVIEPPMPQGTDSANSANDANSANSANDARPQDELTPHDDVADVVLLESDSESSSGVPEQPEIEAEVIPVDFAAAEALYQERAYSEAALHFAVYTDAHPQNPWGHYMEALSLWKSGSTEAAEVSFLRALDCEPDHLKSLINLTRVRLEQGLYEEARLPIERAVSLSPETAEIHRVFGRVEHNLGNSVGAEESYLQSLRIEPADVWSLNNLGLLRIEGGRYEEALAPLALARVLDEHNATVQNNLGAALERSGDLRSAELAYLTAVEIDPTYLRAEESRLRVAALMDQQSRPLVDLTELARRFGEELAASDSFAGEEAEPVEELPIVESTESGRSSGGDTEADNVPVLNAVPDAPLAASR